MFYQLVKCINMSCHNLLVIIIRVVWIVRTTVATRRHWAVCLLSGPFPGRWFFGRLRHLFNLGNCTSNMTTMTRIRHARISFHLYIGNPTSNMTTTTRIRHARTSGHDHHDQDSSRQDLFPPLHWELHRQHDHHDQDSSRQNLLPHHQHNHHDQDSSRQYHVPPVVTSLHHLGHFYPKVFSFCTLV